MNHAWNLEIVFESEADCAMAAEALPAVLEELGAQGLEETSATEGAHGLVAFFPAEVEEKDVMRSVRRAARLLRDEGLLKASPRLSATRAKMHDWVARFRQGFRGVNVAPGLRVAPPWRAGRRAGGVEILIDPGAAFGTGMHETTRLSLQILMREIRGGERIVDLGAGSGILSIAAVGLGARSAWAVEVDPQAHENLRHNIRLNRLGRRVHVFEAGAAEFSADCRAQSRHFDLIVCNMLPERVRPFLSNLRDFAAVSKTARIILSGHLWKERDEWFDSVRQAGITIESERKRGEWGALAGSISRPGRFAP